MVMDLVASNNISFSKNHDFYCFLVYEEFLTINMHPYPN